MHVYGNLSASNSSKCGYASECEGSVPEAEGCCGFICQVPATGRIWDPWAAKGQAECLSSGVGGIHVMYAQVHTCACAFPTTRPYS